MLKIINTLGPFFEDNYQRIHVRKYAKLQKVSPPTASKILKVLHKDKLLNVEIDKKYYCYYANKASTVFKDLQRIYWKQKIIKSGVIDVITQKTTEPVIILFGSAAKGELTKDSDIDIVIITASSENIDLSDQERRIKRAIQLFRYKSLESIPKNLRNNILNGYILEGSW